MAVRAAIVGRLLCAVSTLLVMAQVHGQTSPLFEGRTADFWLYDAGSGQVTAYDKGSDWIENYVATEYGGLTLDAGDVILINWLQNSSLPMTPGQPAVSIAGVGDEALFIGGAGEGGHRDLTIAPASAGPYTNTLAVTIGVSSSVLAAGDHTLAWTVTRETDTIPTTVVIDESIVIPRGSGATGENGYFLETFHLVYSGNYVVNASLSGIASTASGSRTYDLVIAPQDARRDTDGDGIPDVVEADTGLDPFEDDLTADLDGDGWSEFDEWLRRFCLDPVTRQPLAGDTSCIEPNGVPIDSDDDEWSDFDEILRGTNPFDPEPVIPAQVAAPAGNDVPDVTA